MTDTQLSKQEISWLLEQRVTRLTDNQEVLIYPMGAERFLYSVLFENKEGRYTIKDQITGKDVLVIPGYGNTAFLFAQAGALSVTVYDKDPVTIAWMKAFKKWYNYRQFSAKGKPYPSIGELLKALTCWYPPLFALPSGSLKNTLSWILHPKSLRRSYIYYMLFLVREALQAEGADDFELDKKISFHVGELKDLIKDTPQKTFDTAYVPYLLGVTHGIEQEHEIVDFIKQLIKLTPKGVVLVTPSRKAKEFHIAGQNYLASTNYPCIQAIPDLNPYFIIEDQYWFSTQGLSVFGRR